jgi:hypothetical protein
MPTMQEQIIRRIYRLGDGKVFWAGDFLDIARRSLVDVTLAELALNGRLRRICRGLYEMPSINPVRRKKVRPDIHEIARAIARRQQWRVVPEGPLAAHMLGLSRRRPSNIIYFTDGPNKRVRIGNRTLHFKNVRPSWTAGLDGKSALVVLALHYIGELGIGPTEITKLQAVLARSETRKLLDDTRGLANWYHEVAKRVAGEETL